MAINKVIDRNGNTLIDLTADTIRPNKVLSGTKFHGSDGKEYTGSLPANELDTLKYTFIDYDGTLLYSYTDEELDALTELPAGPDHTDDNLTFQEWNWSLEDLKAWDRTRPDRPIVGANLITTDGKSYLYIDTPISNGELKFEKRSGTITVDWGDGTIDNNVSHTYANPGQYIVTIECDNFFYFNDYESLKSTSLRPWIKKIKLGGIKPDSSGYLFFIFSNCYHLESINIPSGLQYVDSSYTAVKALVLPKSNSGNSAKFTGFRSLEIISLPKGITEIIFNACYSLKNIVLTGGISFGRYAFQSTISLKNITIPDNITMTGDSTFSKSGIERIVLSNSITIINNSVFSECYNLKEIIIPNSVTSIGGYAFQQCKNLNKIIIPDSVTSIGGYAFSNIEPIVLDLSEQTKVISLSGNPSFYSGKGTAILIPSNLLDQYKSASYWSSYADYMVGV